MERLRSVGILTYFTDDPRCDWEFRAFIAPYGNVYFYCAQNKVVWGAGNTERGIVEWLSKNVLRKCITAANPRVEDALRRYLAKNGYADLDHRITQKGTIIRISVKDYLPILERLVFTVDSFCGSHGYTYAADDDEIIINIAEIKYEPEES